MPINGEAPPTYNTYPDAPAPPPQNFVQAGAPARRSFRCLAITFGSMSTAALFGGGYCFFSPPEYDGDSSLNYSQQFLGITLIALGTLGCLATGCLAFSKAPPSRLDDEERDDDGIFL